MVNYYDHGTSSDGCGSFNRWRKHEIECLKCNEKTLVDETLMD